jgi:hypothetical protein
MLRKNKKQSQSSEKCANYFYRVPTPERWNKTGILAYPENFILKAIVAVMLR